MTWPNQEIRKLLALLNKPDKLEKFPLAVQLKEALSAPSARDAVLRAIDVAFSVRTPLNDAMREAILSCDVDGNKSFRAAARLNVSNRTLFRRRSSAIAALAAVVDGILQNGDSQSRFRYVVARMIAPLESTAAVKMFEKEAATLGDQAAYDAICATLRNGRDVGPSLLERCTGHWRLLAQLEIARTHLVRGNPTLYQNLRTDIQAALERVRGVPYDRVAFELAYVDRLDAVRRCDVDATGDATRRMMQNAGRDPHLVTFALVCEAEQACDDGDLERANALVCELQTLCSRMRNFRLTARTSHVASILHLLCGHYAEALELANATFVALAQVEPEFAACAAANVGRAALLLGESWKRPHDLCSRFPRIYVLGQIDSVWARHLALSDPELAMASADRAVSISSTQEAWGVLAYSRGTRSLILDLVSRTEEAQIERVAAWEEAVRLRRPFYLYDLFFHPAQRSRAHGPFELDERFTMAIGRRFLSIAGATPDKGDFRRWFNAVLAACLDPAQEGRDAAARARRRVFTSRMLWPAPNRVNEPQRRTVGSCFRQLAGDLSYCLPPAERADFIDRFVIAASNLCGDTDDPAFHSSIAT